MAGWDFVRFIFRTLYTPVSKIGQTLDALTDRSGHLLATGSFGWPHMYRRHVILAKVMNPRLERRHFKGLA
jgi:hypothetical protein